jgi:hypothetical protein
MPGGFLSGGVDGTVVRWVLTDSSMKKSSDETVYVCEPKPPKKDDDDNDTPLPMNFSFERAHTWNVNAWEDAQEGKGKEKQTDVDDAMDDAAFAADAGGEDGDEDGDMEVGLDDGADEEEILGGSQPDEFTVGVRCLHATWADSHWFWDAGKKGNGEFEFKQTITVVVATLHSDIWVFKLGASCVLLFRVLRRGSRSAFVVGRCTHLLPVRSHRARTCLHPPCRLQVRMEA